MESSFSLSLSHTYTISRNPSISPALHKSDMFAFPGSKGGHLNYYSQCALLGKVLTGEEVFWRSSHGKFYRSTKKNALLITSGVQAFLFTPTLGMHCIAQRHFYLYNHWGTTGRNTLWHVTTVWCQGDTCCWVSGTCAAPARCHCYWAGKMQWSDHQKGMYQGIPSFFFHHLLPGHFSSAAVWRWQADETCFRLPSFI